jgi:hypothetical protein
MRLNRRHLIAAAAAATLPPLGQAQSRPAAGCVRPNTPSDPLRLETADEALDRGRGIAWRKPALAAAVTSALWRTVEPLTLPGPAAGTQLTVSEADLTTRLARLGGGTRTNLTVVAVRGARPEVAETGPHSALRLTVRPPDHHNFHCTLIVWDRTARTLSGFVGSTVPNRTAIVAAGLGVQNANMLLPGVFSYSLGSHSHYGTIGCAWGIPGAVRQNARGGERRRLACLRPTRADGFRGARTGTTTDDNIHCAETPLMEPWDRFSSEGCLTVAGRYTPEEGATGPWAGFSRAISAGGAVGAARTLWLVTPEQLSG